MMKLLFSTIALAVVVSACGGDSGGDAQNAVADLFIEVNRDEGLEVDADCVKETTARLSDDDAQALVDAGVDGNPDLSPEGEAMGNLLFSSCVDVASYVDLVVSSLAETGGTAAADCMHEQLQGLSIVEIDDKMVDILTACASG